MDNPGQISQPINLEVPGIQSIILDEKVIKYYANGFLAARTQTDIMLIPTVNGTPDFVLNLSFITAKNLLLYLGQSIEEVEKILGHRIEQLPFIAPSENS